MVLIRRERTIYGSSRTGFSASAENGTCMLSSHRVRILVTLPPSTSVPLTNHDFSPSGVRWLCPKWSRDDDEFVKVVDRLLRRYGGRKETWFGHF